MVQEVKINLGDVQKTLFLPLWGRAEELRKQKPLLVDKTAIRIIEQVDFDFSEIAQNINGPVQIGWVKRSLFCDRVVKEFLGRYPEGTIVNIGCGLDTTFERTDNGKLKWYDLDLPDVIELRSKFVQENERRRFITASFLENEWLEAIEGNGNVLFIAAGVFCYFEESEIKGFLIRLLERYPGSEILFDVMTPLGMKISNKRVIESSGLDEKSRLTWGLKKTDDVLSWDPRIRLINTYHYYRTDMPGLLNTLMGMLTDFIGITYMIHLKLGTSPSK